MTKQITKSSFIDVKPIWYTVQAINSIFLQEVPIGLGKFDMTNDESDADKNVESFKSQGKSWALALFKDVSPELRVIAKETIIFVAFILSDMFVVWLLSLELGEIAWLYEGIRLISAVTISGTFLGNCIIEIDKSRRRVLALSQHKLSKEE